MTLIALLFLLTGSFANSIWVVYGVGLARRDTSRSSCDSCIVLHPTTTVAVTSSYIPKIQWISQPSPMGSVNPTPTPTSEVGIAIDTRSSPTPSPFIAYDTPDPPQLTMTSIITPSPTSAPSTQIPTDATTLSAGGAVGIGVGLAALMLIVAFIVLGIPYFHRWRRTRALQRAVDEVERGVELDKTPRPPSVPKTKDNMVLESRVEIVVEDETNKVNVLDAWNGWDATDDHNEEGETGRKGMSLPRREL